MAVELETQLKDAPEKSKSKAAEASARNKRLSRGKPPNWTDFLGMVSERIGKREVVIAEEYLPGRDATEQGWALYAFWIFHPAEACKQTFRGASRDASSQNKVYCFAAASDVFSWCMGCTPVYQEVLLPMLGFSGELRLALHNAGWCQCLIDLRSDCPYDFFHDWCSVRTRMLQAKYSMTVRAYGKLQAQFQMNASSDPALTFSAAVHAQQSLTQALATEHRKLLDDYKQRTIGSNGNTKEVSISRYYAFIRNQLVPLNACKKTKLPRRALQLNDKQVPFVPLTKLHRMRWSVVKGKVVRRRMKDDEHAISTPPKLAPIEEARMPSAASSHTDSALLVRPVSRKSLNRALKSDPGLLPIRAASPLSMLSDDVLLYEVRSQ